MDHDEREYVKKINIDKAKNILTVCIGLTLISLLTYCMPLLYGDFDFGMILEIITLILAVIARFYTQKYDEDRSRIYAIIAIIPIGQLLIYDLIQLFFIASDILDLAFMGIGFYGSELLTILDIMLLFRAYKSLRKAWNPERYKESTDWFYESLKEKNDEEVKQ